MPPFPLFVLLTWTDRQDAAPDDVTVTAVYGTFPDVLARLGRIDQANPQYPMRKLSPTLWRLGPDEDQGFFGDKPRYFRVVATSLQPLQEIPA